jgi:hypothetical protein
MYWEDARGTVNVVYGVPSHEGRPGRWGRRWPLPVPAAAVAVCSLVMASGAEPLPLAVLVGVAGYLVASRVPRPVSIAAVAAAAAVLGAALGYAALARTGAPVAVEAVEAVEGFLPLAAAWFVGGCGRGAPPVPGGFGGARRARAGGRGRARSPGGPGGARAHCPGAARCRRQALRAGASGFALKSRPVDELLSAIRVVAEGEALLAPSVTRRLIAHFSRASRVPPERRRDFGQLAEREVLSLLVRGLSNTELATRCA